MKILAGAVGKTDLEDKNKDVNKDPGNKDPHKNDVIIDMEATVTPEIKKSKFIQEETKYEKRERRFEKFLRGVYILLFVWCMAGVVILYFR